MACSTVDDRVVGEILAVVDHDRPEVDKHKECNIGHLLKRKDEREDVVRQGLSEAIKRVEGVAGKGSRHNPLVVKLVQILVDQTVVKPAMSPVDAKVGKKKEEWELKEVIPQAGSIFGGVVQFAVASNFEEEEGRCDDGHDWHGLVGCNDLHADLIFNESRVLKGALVEDEYV